MNKIILVVAVSLLFACSGKQELKLKTSGMEIEFSSDGKIKNVVFENDTMTKMLQGYSALKGCQILEVQANKTSEGSVSFIKKIQDTLTKRTLDLTETFTAESNSIRWEISIVDKGNSWSTPIETVLQYPASENVGFWTPWADPRGDISNGGTDNGLIANAIIGGGDLSDFSSWADPLVELPLRNALWHYGAPRYTYEKPGILYCPFQGDVISIPMISFVEKHLDIGLSLVLSLDDTLLDINMETTEDGGVKFSRFNHRIGNSNELNFSMDIVPHQADWRASLGWVANKYKKYFYPTNPLAKEISGTGAYSNSDADFDVDKMKKMAFRVNWRASFDFPFMGMFIPPASDTEIWSSFVRKGNIGKVKPKPTSIPNMNNYCKKMDDHGFYVLSYFNVTEFGTQIEYPRPSSTRKEGEPIWKNANDYLYENLSNAMLFVPEKQVPVLDKGIYSARPGLPFWTWEKAIVVDPGVKEYQDFLVEQAKRTVEKLPNSYGICIDRMDWTRFYNHKTDDGVSWMGGQAVGSMYMSWNNIMDKLHPIFHDNNKVIYVNNHVKRIEQLKYVDGIFDEFTYAGSPLNAIAFLGTHKPTLGWMSKDEQLLPDPDAVMQKYLYLGVFPMAPFPGNDHSIRPSELADKVYLDYGTLFNQMRGKEWVLEAHVISASDKKANVNLFKTFDGYTIPVVYANKSNTIDVIVRKKDLIKEGLKIQAYFPGDEKPVLVESKVVDGELIITTPLKRNCAVLKILI